MADRPSTIFLCSCDDTIPLDAGAVRRGCCSAKIETAGQLCRAEIERFRAAVAAGASLTVGCTQEAPLFSEVAQEGNKQTDLIFVNVRETAGWSSQGAEAGPKMAALLAAAAVPTPIAPVVTLHQRRRSFDLRLRRAGDRGRAPAQGASRRHRDDHETHRDRRRSASTNSPS